MCSLLSCWSRESRRLVEPVRGLWLYNRALHSDSPLRIVISISLVVAIPGMFQSCFFSSKQIKRPKHIISLEVNIISLEVALELDDVSFVRICGMCGVSKSTKLFTTEFLIGLILLPALLGVRSD